MTLEHFGRVISLFGPLCEEPVDDSGSPSFSRSKTPTSGRSSPVKVCFPKFLSFDGSL